MLRGEAVDLLNSFKILENQIGSIFPMLQGEESGVDFVKILCGEAVKFWEEVWSTLFSTWLGGRHRWKHIEPDLPTIYFLLCQIPNCTLIFAQMTKHKQMDKEKGTAKVCANSGEVPINTRRSHEPVNGCPAKWV